MAKNTYTVQAGDNLAKIAEKLYGDQRFLALLLAANGGSTLIHPGDVLNVPGVPGGVKPNAPFGSGQQLEISQGLWNYIQAQDAAYGFGGASTQPAAPTFPAPGTYNNPPPSSGAAGADAAGFPPAPGPPPPSTYSPQQPDAGLELDVPPLTPPLTVSPVTTPGGRPLEGSYQQYQYGAGQPNPVGPSTPILAPSLKQVYNPYSGAFGAGQTAGDLAGLIDAQLNYQKPEGTYQVKQAGFVNQPYGDGTFGPQYAQAVGNYVNTQVSGGKPGAYLVWDSIKRTKTIGGGEGYPDLVQPWTEWAMKQIPWPVTAEETPGGGGGFGYGGGYGRGGYKSGDFTYPQASFPARPLSIGPARSFVPSRGSGYPFFGGGAQRAPGISNARSAAMVALVSWTL